MPNFDPPPPSDLQRLHEAIQRFCWGVALFNMVLFSLPIIAFLARCIASR